MNRFSSRHWLCGALVVALGCGPSEKVAPPEEKTGEATALATVKAYIQTNLNDLETASVALANAAPAPDTNGWNATQDAAAVEAMKVQWRKARVAYEHVEGAIAVLFPELDISTDERYDGFLATAEDDNLFDGEGVTGIHAIERVLWSDSIPERVRTFESALPGYQPAAFPSTAAEATDFKAGLCARMVQDVKKMRADFTPLALDPATAYRGIIGSMAEQVEKATLAGQGEEESRYAQYTLADMRANVEAGVKTFEAFRPWLAEKGGSALDTQIRQAFDRLEREYAALRGEALPPVPETWNSTQPSAADLQTPFGKLYSALQNETDEDAQGSLVSSLNASADLLGIPLLAE